MAAKNFRRGRIIPTALVMLAGVITVMAWPLVAGHLKDLEAQREFQAADDPLQAELVRAYLQHNMDRFASEAAGYWRDQDLYFDTTGATLCGPEQRAACDDLDYIAVNRDGTLVDPDNAFAPLQLQRLLDRITLYKTRNVDPRMAGVTTLTSPAWEDFAKACVERPSRTGQLVRMSRGVVQVSEGRAIALVTRMFCDRSGGTDVFNFERQGAKWIMVPRWYQ